MLSMTSSLSLSSRQIVTSLVKFASDNVFVILNSVNNIIRIYIYIYKITIINAIMTYLIFRLNKLSNLGIHRNKYNLNI